MKRNIDKIFLIISIAIGIVISFADEIVYTDVIFSTGTRVFIILAYVMIFALAMGIVLLIKGLQNGTYVNFGKIIAFTLLATIALGGFTALFEYLYEMQFNLDNKLISKKAQYVFVIDDSSTMEGNDKYFQRYEAVQDIVNSLDSTRDFAVYSFASNTVCLTPIGTQESKSYILNKPTQNRGGSTRLGDALNTVLAEVSNAEKQTNVIVLTDGAPTDIKLNNTMYGDVVSQCSAKNTSISSVGFGNPNENFLQTLAGDTGGVFVYADDITTLTANMGTIVSTVSNKSPANRDLLGPRYDSTSGSFLYGFLRVLFLIILGALWTIVKMLLVGEKKFMLSSMLWSFGLCTLAAVICEILCHFWIPGVVVRAVFLGLWACTIIPEAIYNKITLNGALNSEQSGPAMGVANDFNNRSKGGAGHNSFL